ncbi:MAG TPA: hypothetical protein DEG28_09340, partial [Porphyromonadaceae bacterium]|nr:hypothetical protein [Porphyromonadaceae bacterium]
LLRYLQISVFLFLYIREKYREIVFNLIVKNANVLDFGDIRIIRAIADRIRNDEKGNGRGL